MPKTTTVKSRKPASPPSLPPKGAKSSATQIDKEAMVQILLAKLDDNRSFDWYELSQKLNVSVSGGKSKGKGKGKAKEEEGMSGSELRDVYTDVILPAIRRGMMPWGDNTSDTSGFPPTTPDAATPDVPPNQGKSKRDAKEKKDKAGKGKDIEEEYVMEDDTESEYEEEESM